VNNKQKFAFLGFNLPLMLKGLSLINNDGAYLDAYICNIQLGAIPGVDPLISAILGQATPSGKVQYTPICR
jgi:phospholipid/cholesterol/gamma-HCH transport system substrate-binding protein